jgi:hypothetical protein
MYPPLLKIITTFRSFWLVLGVVLFGIQFAYNLRRKGDTVSIVHDRHPYTAYAILCYIASATILINTGVLIKDGFKCLEPVAPPYVMFREKFTLEFATFVAASAYVAAGVCIFLGRCVYMGCLGGGALTTADDHPITSSANPVKAMPLKRISVLELTTETRAPRTLILARYTSRFFLPDQKHARSAPKGQDALQEGFLYTNRIEPTVKNKINNTTRRDEEGVHPTRRPRAVGVAVRGLRGSEQKRHETQESNMPGRRM